LIRAGKVEALLDGRKAVGIVDLQKVAYPALRHRIILNFEAQAEGQKPDAIIADIISKVEIPSK
jgi:MoxR-like ATPase